jgi:transcription initiation factor TFIIB
MRREHNRARISSKAERNQVYAFTEIKRIVSSLSLPESVREQACALFESAQSTDLIRGRSLEGFAAAAVYATCRTRSISRTIDEIARVARADSDELQVGYDALNRELGLPTGPIDPGEYLPRYASELGLETDVERKAREYLTMLLAAGVIGGRNPSGLSVRRVSQGRERRGDHPGDGGQRGRRLASHHPLDGLRPQRPSLIAVRETGGQRLETAGRDVVGCDCAHWVPVISRPVISRGPNPR